jgi:hypothetical protein
VARRHERDHQNFITAATGEKEHNMTQNESSVRSEISVEASPEKKTDLNWIVLCLADLLELDDEEDASLIQTAVFAGSLIWSVIDRSSAPTF